MFCTGLTIAQWRKKHNLTHATVYRVINNRLQTPEYRQAISEATGLSIDQLWPDDDNVKKIWATRRCLVK